MAAIVCWQSEAGCAESKSDQMCEIRLSYPTWPSRWVLCISRQWLRLKGCHVTCDEWTSGEICSLQHMWVNGSVMWAAASDESLKFGVQGASATNWFPRVNGVRDNGIRLYIFTIHLTLGCNGFGKDNCKTRWQTFKFGNLMRLILEILFYIYSTEKVWLKFFKECPSKEKVIIGFSDIVFLYFLWQWHFDGLISARLQ